MTGVNVAADHDAEGVPRSGGTVNTSLHQLTVVPPAGATNWRQHAACRGEDTELFYPGEHDPQLEAKAFCRICPVRVECLEYALAENIQHGIWGGLAINARREIRKQRYRAGQAQVRAVRDAAAPALPARLSRAAHP